ncbi:MAG: IMP cyclohydrolase, partial [Oscillospiraceae bacterium]|nr:IMP cyclohydrolase [Oscillospiraceae bacterium]
MKQDLCRLLRENAYPGRGIMLGNLYRPGANAAVIAYFIMGRSENSRNRVFEETEDGIRTRAFDESKMTDPSLIIYHPVRTAKQGVIVTNGDQTDTIRDYFEKGECYVCALRSREYEPDHPNYTPRISGVLKRNGDYNLSILKYQEEGGCCRQFFEYTSRANVGHFISTYQGDGDPLPSFAGEPVKVAVTAPN